MAAMGLAELACHGVLAAGGAGTLWVVAERQEAAEEG